MNHIYQGDHIPKIVSRSENKCNINGQDPRSLIEVLLNMQEAEDELHADREWRHQSLQYADFMKKHDLEQAGALMMEKLFANVMKCPASGVRLSHSGNSEPVSVYGCGCIAARAAAEQFIRRRRCHVCKLRLPKKVFGRLKVDDVALQLVRDFASTHRPMLPSFDLRVEDLDGKIAYRACEREHNSQVAKLDENLDDPSHWSGSKAKFCLWYPRRRFIYPGHPDLAAQTSFGKPSVTVMTVSPPPRKLYPTANGVITQHLASLVSTYVEPVFALDWGCNVDACPPTRVHIAMPTIHCTMRSFLHAKQPREPGKLLERLLCLFGKLACAVLSIHSFGIVHCDLSSSSVMLDVGLNPRLTGFCTARRHATASVIRSCVDAGCAVRDMRAWKMEGHVCAAVDVHDLGQTMASAMTLWLKGVEHDMPAADAVAEVYKEARSWITTMTDTPQQCCLVATAAVFRSLQTDVTQ